MTGHSDGFLPVENGRLYYEVDGPAGAPTLTLVHAGVATLRTWDEQMAGFVAAGYCVIRYDQCGFGRTESQDATFSNRDDIHSLLDHVGVASTALVGLSRGGTIALDFALEHPERVNALVICATTPSGFDFAEPEMDAVWAEEERLEALEDWDAIVELETRIWLDGPGQSPDRVPAHIRDRMRADNRDNYRGQGRGQPRPLDPPAVGRMAEVSVPTLIAWGNLDTATIAAGGDAMTAGIRGARRHVFPGTAHMLNLEHPEAFERLVLDFLAASGAGA